MKYNPDIHHRRSIRLKNFDYSQNGAYFITLCTYERKNLFGYIDSDKMHLNALGMMVQEEWLKSFKIRKELAMDAYIIMPNHLHGIVFISHQDNRNNPPLWQQDSLFAQHEIPCENVCLKGRLPVAPSILKT